MLRIRVGKVCSAQTRSRESMNVHFVLAVTSTNYCGANLNSVLAHLHPRQVALNRRMGHGDADRICASSNNAGLRSPRLDLCLQSRLRCRLVLVVLQDTRLHGPTENCVRYFYVRGKMSFHTHLAPSLRRNNPKLSKTAEQANRRLLKLTLKLQNKKSAMLVC